MRPSFGEQIKKAMHRCRKNGDAMGYVYYTEHAPNIVALASWATYKTSWAGQLWIERRFGGQTPSFDHFGRVVIR